MSDLRIYRYDVPVDDAWHTIELSGPIVSVGARNVGVVEFWAVHYDRMPARPAAFLVVGTGHPINLPDDDDLQYVGTAPIGDLVWHLLGQGLNGRRVACIGSGASL